MRLKLYKKTEAMKGRLKKSLKLQTLSKQGGGAIFESQLPEAKLRISFKLVIIQTLL